MLGTAQRMALDFREGWNGGFFVLYFGAVDPKTGRKRGSFLLLVDILSEHNSQGCTRMVFHMGAEMQICGPYSTAFLAILAELHRKQSSRIPVVTPLWDARVGRDGLALCTTASGSSMKFLRTTQDSMQFKT